MKVRTNAVRQRSMSIESLVSLCDWVAPCLPYFFNTQGQFPGLQRLTAFAPGKYCLWIQPYGAIEVTHV
jgi:hypothetical protein